MYYVEKHVGRLIEVKLASPLTTEDVQAFVQKHLALMAQIPGKYVGVVNLLDAHVFPPAVAQMLAQMLSGASSHVERTALLIGESAIFSLQVERVIRDAQNPNRRSFRNARELITWLSEVLNPAEQRQLERFLAEAHHRASPTPLGSTR
ncbi:MAG TPA: hypothetical protein VHW00_19735 [Thermoanaerobaculia bacterium]|nr:hypothetical protein [Thermoanaerobaculia bacterium]